MCIKKNKHCMITGASGFIGSRLQSLLIKENYSVVSLTRKKQSSKNKKEKKKKVKDDANYTVKKGDTLYSLSKKYNISIDEIKKNNNLKNNQLSIGQKLKI